MAVVECGWLVLIWFLHVADLALQLLKLSQTTIRRITDGHIINVVSNDVQRLDLVCMSFGR